MPLDSSQDRINDLVRRPSESLNVEIKRWIDPTTPDGISKIVKAAIALRNRNGGYLVIGFDDETLRPEDRGRPLDVHAAFHLDAIQSIVARYALPAFEISVQFGILDAVEYPIIVIPDGVTIPVACKRDLIADGSTRNLLREDGVYFRTLNSNGSPSTSLIKAADWRDLFEICFDNREADIARFLRKHFRSSDALAKYAFSDHTEGIVSKTLREEAFDNMQSGDRHRLNAISQRLNSNEIVGIEELGQYTVSLVMNPLRPLESSDSIFLNTIASANPQYTGWPVWLDSRNFSDEESRPRNIARAWEALIISLGQGFSSHADFMRMHAKGEFYLWRVLQDDLTDKVEPKTQLDAALMIYRVAEIIAVGLSFARALGPEVERLGFAFRWSNLGGRELSSWASPTRYISPGRRAYDNHIETYVEVEASIAPQAIAPYVAAALKDVLLAFDGFSVGSTVIEGIVTDMLSRR